MSLCSKSHPEITLKICPVSKQSPEFNDISKLTKRKKKRTVGRGVSQRFKIEIMVVPCQGQVSASMCVLFKVILT